MANGEENLSPDFPLPDDPNRVDPQELRRRKLMFGSLLIVGVGALVFGVVSFFDTLNSPFRPQDTANSSNISFALQNASSIESLRTKDTDTDGLSDYDELYVYQTSPYLADSDSDASTDKAEIDRGSDPNCPDGQSCRDPSITNTNADPTANIDTTSSAVSMELLRESLKSSGAPENIVDNLSDAELLELYNSVVGEDGTATNSTGTTNTSQPNSSSQVTTSDLQNLTPDEIRKFLIEAGVDKSVIDDVDDDTLRAIFEQAINEES